MWGIPLVLGIIITLIGIFTDRENVGGVGVIIAIVGFILILAMPVGFFYHYEVPSMQEKVITVDDWQPTFGKYWGDISSADDLMLKTTDGELFGNKESLFFQKFNTRDILDELKPNGTYKIKYYGWREGFNNGVPNILSVEEVINETNCPQHHDISDYMYKVRINYDGQGDWN
jgi:hypothetical protein